MLQTQYLLIGNGRLARHMGYYLNAHRTDSSRLITWNRQQNTKSDLQEKLKTTSVALLALSDDALEPFYEEHLKIRPQVKVVHFSGSQVIEGAQSAHPLMTFTNELYDPHFYLKIPFVVEKEKTPFHELFPFWDNPYFEIDSDKKPLYHSMCVISGNFTTMLWQKMGLFFESELKLPSTLLNPYQEKIFFNLLHSSHQALTGPFVRKDYNTIESHKKVLSTYPQWLEIYQAFEKLIATPKDPL